MRQYLPVMLLLFVAISATGQQDYNPPEEGRILSGIEYLPEDQKDGLEPLLELQVGDPFNARRLRNSIRNIMRLGVYSDVTVTWHESDTGIVLTLKVLPTPVIEGVTILGNAPLSKQQIVEAANLSSNLRYDQTRDQQIVASIVDAYRSIGYYNAYVSLFSMVNLETEGIRLSIEIDPGQPTTLGDVRISGFPLFTVEEILDAVNGIAIGSPFQEATFRNQLDNIRLFYVNKGYRAAAIGLDSVNWKPQDNTVVVNMTINAGPIIRTRVEPAIADSKRWISLIPFADQNIPVDNILDNGEDEIRNKLRLDGYTDAQVAIDWELIPEEALIEVLVQIDKGLVHTVGGLTIQGLEAEIVQQLLPRLNLSKKGWFSSSRFSEIALQDDLQRTRTFVAQQGYPDASVDARLVHDEGEKRTVGVVLTVETGQRTLLSDMLFQGNEEASDEQLRQASGLEPGMVLSTAAVNNAAQRIRSWYDHRGYVASTIRPRVVGQGTDSTVLFEISEGQKAIIRKIIIAGNSRTQGSVIRGFLTFDVGDPFSLQEVAESQRSLYRTGIFSRVTISTFDDEIATGDKRVVISLLETSPYTLLYGFGLDSEEKFRFNFGFSNNNIAGENVEAGFNARVSQLQQRYQVSFSSPRLFRGKVENRLRLFYEELTRASHGLRRRGMVFETEGLSWRDWDIISQVQYRWVDTFDINPGIQINRFEQPVRLTLFSGIFLRDSRNDPLDPTGGSLSNVILQVSPELLGGDLSFVKFEGQYYRFDELFSNLVLAGGLRVGLAYPLDDRTLLPISERFFLGGSNSIRGFPLEGVGPEFTGADGELYPEGGNAMFNGNLEVRFPLLADIGAVTFYDFGNVYSFIQDIDLGNIEQSVGVGLRFATPLGPLRFDYGISLTTNDNELYFTFGHAF